MGSRRKSGRSAGANVAPLLIAILILALVAGFIYFFWQQRQDGQAASSTTTAATSAPGLVSHNGIIYGGLPKAKNGESPLTTVTVLENRAYMVGYSETRKDPLWSAYHLVARKEWNHLPRPREFVVDERTQARVSPRDYTGRGYDRGHMTPNSAIAMVWGAEAQQETFLMSNICPQAQNLNQKVWEKLEQEETGYANKFGEVWIIDGPVFADVTGGKTATLPSGVAVPEGFYKILVEAHDGHPHAFAVAMPQTVKGTELPGQFVRSVDEIEKATGLEFFPELPEGVKREIKAKANPMW